MPEGQVEAILAVIPRARLRDRVLFGLIAQTGLRAGEALAVHVEDLDLTPDTSAMVGEPPSPATSGSLFFHWILPVGG